MSAELKALLSAPASILKTIPGGAPPQGVIPNYANPPTRVPVILGVGTAFLVFASVCFSIRIYTKVVIAKNWKWDDGKYLFTNIRAPELTNT